MCVHGAVIDSASGCKPVRVVCCARARLLQMKFEAYLKNNLSRKGLLDTGDAYQKGRLVNTKGGGVTIKSQSWAPTVTRTPSWQATEDEDGSSDADDDAVIAKFFTTCPIFGRQMRRRIAQRLRKITSLYVLYASSESASSGGACFPITPIVQSALSSLDVPARTTSDAKSAAAVTPAASDSPDAVRRERSLSSEWRELQSLAEKVVDCLEQTYKDPHSAACSDSLGSSRSTSSITLEASDVTETADLHSNRDASVASASSGSVSSSSAGNTRSADLNDRGQREASAYKSFSSEEIASIAKIKWREAQTVTSTASTFTIDQATRQRQLTSGCGAAKSVASISVSSVKNQSRPPTVLESE